MKNAALSGLVTAAVIAAPAYAQSSVTLFGIVDATLAIGSGSLGDRKQLANNGWNSSRIGFRGTEDLGRGTSASFWLEAGFSPDSGLGGTTNTNNQASGAAPTGAAIGQGLTFNRRSTVSLAGGWGELRIGRDLTPQYVVLLDFDPFNHNGVGTSQTLNSIITGVTSIRASNSVGYFLPSNLSGFYGQTMYYLGENSSNAGSTKNDGNGYGVRLGYALGPWSISASTGQTKYATGDTRQSNLGSSWDFGIAKLMGQISRDEVGLTNGKGWVFGAIAPAGSGEFRFSLSEYKIDNASGTEPKVRKLAVGYGYNLSKRTALYTAYARIRNDGGASSALNGAATTPNASSSGVDVGIRHRF